MSRAAWLVLGLMTVGGAYVSAQAPMDLDDLVRRGDLYDVYLHPETFEPYDGAVEATWVLTGTLRERGTLVEGKWDGLHEWYHLNGQLSTRETYLDGQLNGLSEAYFKSGQLSVVENYDNGRLDGPYEAYWVRGMLAEKGNWSAGEQCGEWLSFGRTTMHPPC